MPGYGENGCTGVVRESHARFSSADLFPSATNLRTVRAAMNTRARNVINALRAFVLLFGAAALWLARDGMNADGVAYLDASDVYLSGGWPASGSGYWSPLYPTLLAAARLVLGTSPGRELAITQAVNFAVFVLAFVALEFLMRSVRAVTRIRQPTGELPNDFTWRVLVYALFVVATIGWIRIWTMTPDMCVAALVFATAGLCVRIAGGRTGWANVLMLGVTLGLGFLAKAAFFPFALVVLVTLALVLRHRHEMRRVAIAALVFLAISAPQMVYASKLKGSPTFSDVGRLTYLWFIADVPGPVSSAFRLPSRLPGPEGKNQTVAPLDRSTGVHPAVYDIDAPIPGTLPVWYDAGYWYRGVTAPLLPMRIVRAVVRHGRVYIEMFGLLLVGALAAAFTRRVSWRDVIAMQPAGVLAIPAVAVLAMYALMLVQDRYVAPFALLLFAGLVPPWATDDLSRRVRVGLATGALVAMVLVLHSARVDAAYWSGSARARTNVVAALGARGIGPGSRIAFIGEAYDALWARQARLRVVSLVPLAEAERFWDLSVADRAAVLAHMRDRGATAIIAESPALGVDIDGWERLPSAGVPRGELIVYGRLR